MKIFCVRHWQSMPKNKPFVLPACPLVLCFLRNVFRISFWNSLYIEHALLYSKQKGVLQIIVHVTVALTPNKAVNPLVKVFSRIQQNCPAAWKLGDVCSFTILWRDDSWTWLLTIHEHELFLRRRFGNGSFFVPYRCFVETHFRRRPVPPSCRWFTTIIYRSVSLSFLLRCQWSNWRLILHSVLNPESWKNAEAENLMWLQVKKRELHFWVKTFCSTDVLADLTEITMSRKNRSSEPADVDSETGKFTSIKILWREERFQHSTAWASSATTFVHAATSVYSDVRKTVQFVTCFS